MVLALILTAISLSHSRLQSPSSDARVVNDVTASSNRKQGQRGDQFVWSHHFLVCVGAAPRDNRPVMIDRLIRMKVNCCSMYGTRSRHTDNCAFSHCHIF
ncbi:hypothetical protein GGR58DRAFT_312795 [Xylaria digitata]|nr:hypothetical protein GGR58DRAFT_312795 [Xylaria digitata]